MSKRKGSNAERDLVHKFWEVGWACIRVAGSGSSKYPSPDLLASNKIRTLAIECKILADEVKYFSHKEIDELREFCAHFRAEAWVALKFSGMEWHFLNLEDLRETKASYVCSKEDAQHKGLLLQEIIKN